MKTEELKLVTTWDNTFPKSEKVDHRKITFMNRYGITLVADMYIPKNAEGPFPAIAVSGPFGAVKEQCSGLYAQIMAEGQYITFIDADDKIDIEYLRNLYDCIRTSKADIVISGYKKIWEESDRIEPGKMNVHGLVNMVDILPRFAEWQKESGIFGYCWAKIFPRELCKDIYFDTSLRLAEDFDFYLKLYRKIKTIYFDDAQNYLYLQEAENSSVAKNDYDIDYMAQLKINLRYKEFLEYKNVFCDSNKRILTEIISNYFYFSLFYCDMSQFKNVFQKLYSIYKEIKIEFVTENIFSKWLLFLLKNNREREIKYSIKFYRAIKKCIRI